jgi:hypothetical protein
MSASPRKRRARWISPRHGWWIGWVAFGFLTGSIAGILANLSFIGFNCHGYFRWKRKP